MRLADDLSAVLAGPILLPRSLLAKALFVFSAMLAEADHAIGPERERVLEVAWQWKERLREGLEAGASE